jgi:formate dehydrogenase maturation protein FdhE
MIKLQVKNDEIKHTKNGGHQSIAAGTFSRTHNVKDILREINECLSNDKSAKVGDTTTIVESMNMSMTNSVY